MPNPDDPEQRVLLDRFAAALENADANALSELLREELVLEMPPVASWFAGREAVTRIAALHLLTGPGQLRPTPILANGQPAFALYRRDVSGRYEAHAVLVLAHLVRHRPHGELPRLEPVQAVRTAGACRLTSRGDSRSAAESISVSPSTEGSRAEREKQP